MDSLVFEFDLSNDKDKSLLKEISEVKIKLPNIKRLVINKISDSNSDLASFLSNSVPDKLDLFWMNHPYISSTISTKIDFYIDSLCEAIKGVSKEIYIVNLIVGEKDLEKIVKASCNWERLVIRFSDILCSSALDFSIDSDYKTKSLSFYNWGYNDSRKSSWLTDSSLFENIVEGIGKSGLKQSLQTVDIYGCKLDKSKVQEMFTKHGMTNVSVVEDAHGGNDPKTE